MHQFIDITAYQEALQAEGKALDHMQSQAHKGRPPHPGQLQAALSQARHRTSCLAQEINLETGQDPQEILPWLELFDQSIHLCMELAGFTLHLGRHLGFEYLPGRSRG
ncbi:MAG: hypothetical protein PVG03_08970 [Desulfarculaceae bacterium]|jgi:hypothetical protein